jgi:hypothetical protein
MHDDLRVREGCSPLVLEVLYTARRMRVSCASESDFRRYAVCMVHVVLLRAPTQLPACRAAIRSLLGCAVWVGPQQTRRCDVRGTPCPPARTVHAQPAGTVGLACVRSDMLLYV